jgi:hypothetical protein
MNRYIQINWNAKGCEYRVLNWTLRTDPLARNALSSTFPRNVPGGDPKKEPRFRVPPGRPRHRAGPGVSTLHYHWPAEPNSAQGPETAGTP